MPRLLYLLPAAVALGVAIAAFWLLIDPDRDPGAVPSPLIGKPAPAFQLPVLATDGQGADRGADRGAAAPETVSDRMLKGRVTVVNVFASWCAPCRVEHPVLMEMARRGTVRMVGINYKDDPEAARQWLSDLGNPFDVIGVDRQGRASIDWGVYGIPETFVLDENGIIRHKHVGPIMPEDYSRTLRPLIDRLTR